MSDALPLVTVIVPTKPGQEDIPAVTAARQFDYPKGRLEILVARGRQPSVQRNAALRAARGELIYFLDDDAVAQSGNLRRAFAHFADPQVKMVGGPGLCPADAPLLEQVFAVVLASWLAFGPSRARYDSVGQVRATGEKELILCNLMARRDAVLELGGFDEALYPNEENALMDGLQKRGAKLLYDPQFIAYRRPRRTLKAFCKMLFTYGRGRAEQFRLHPTPGSALNFVPPLFCLYLVVVLFFGLIPFSMWEGLLTKSEALMGRAITYLILPLLIGLPSPMYFLALLWQTYRSSRTRGWKRSLLAMPLLLGSHIFYGLGFWRGLITKLKKAGAAPPPEVTLDSMSV